MFLKKRYACCLLLLLWALSLPAQMVSRYVYIDSIVIEGAKVTREALIYRELDIRVGDSVWADDLALTIERNRLRTLNLGIFSNAAMRETRRDQHNHITLRLDVNESWYWIPSPVFELIDRNFNVWAKEFNYSLSRTNYGLDYTQNNVTGHADRLNITATAGYNQRFNLRYRTPTINRKQTIGLQFGVGWSRTREVGFITQGNILKFVKTPDDYTIRRFQAEAALTWRPGLLKTHGFSLEYRDTRTLDTVARELNPNFFLNGATRQRYTSLLYSFLFDNVDVRPYPTKGWKIYVEFRQNGLLPNDDLHLFRGRAEVSKFTRFNPWLSLETAARARVSLPRTKPPYFNNQALGHGNDLVRGYEYFVMDGLDLYVLKTSFRTQVLNTRIPIAPAITRQIKQLKSIPVRMYLALQNDAGYAYDPWYAEGNPLVNRMLYGYGLALDVVIYYNSTFQVALMRNDLGQQGVFVKTRMYL
jgi:outer membrane protein assembly factor BamA